ncbi:MAG: 30S ribosome-binding factor RbfA [Acidobacteria bacterium]|nr:MAG: 30S ribosome-binding factor RbfA [Acidobacteriota bacterium]
MSPPARRQERLADQIRAEVAHMITEELKDPRIGFTTVTRVELSADLGHARVLVSVLGGPDLQQHTMEGLSSAAGYIRREVTHRLGLRRAPELTFVFDHGPEDATKIDALLRELKERQ